MCTAEGQLTVGLAVVKAGSILVCRGRWSAGLLVVFGWLLLPGNVCASCGDHLAIPVGGSSFQDSSSNHRPRSVPCHGPSCRESAPQSDPELPPSSVPDTEQFACVDSSRLEHPQLTQWRDVFWIVVLLEGHPAGIEKPPRRRIFVAGL